MAGDLQHDHGVTAQRHPASLPVLYIAAALSGVGAGAVYGTCVGNALKWFADRRGFAAGLTAAGFGGAVAQEVSASESPKAPSSVRTTQRRGLYRASGIEQ